MIIRRMQVEGGFLDGLDLRFEEGLNVLIGGRGTGKSSVIELIRYCLDVRGSSSEEDAKRAREQALSVLQDGQVTLSIEDAGSNLLVSRSVDADPEGLEPDLARPLIFSQTDVESFGLSARGRLNIIDFFSPDSSAQRAEERKRVTQIQSLTTEVRGLLREADHIADRLSGAESVQAELARAEARAAEMSKTSQQLEQKQRQLEALSAQSANLSVRQDALRRAQDAASEYRETLLETQLFGFTLDDWPATAGADLLKPARLKLGHADKRVKEALDLLAEVIGEIERTIKSVEKERAPLEEQARIIRREVEGLKEGAGAAARQLAGLREQSTQLEALRTLRAQKLERVGRVQKQRRGLLDQLDSLREARCAERQRVAKLLTKNLSPLIRVKIRQSAEVAEFIGAITNALRGSGLRYNELAQALAIAMTPRELVEAAESDNISFLSKTAKISSERAQRIAAQLRSAGVEGIIGLALDDAADFELLDGTQFKSMGELSVGQRCTVVLSILLQHPDRVLIVDQPEDHLDNAFIAETLIGAIRRHSERSQLIFSTHNANIPVLGEASQVVTLGSNGQRGFVVHAGPLDAPKSVKAISSVMEGGDEAFRTRAAFYGRSTNR
ncbi:AAA family ATPase [Bradyrhizobium sp. 197]|uniref:AAA family ATPase n=1 Tax=Bradyrhizobium sp. 197 TaxID=2782663 RepID=UPI001FF84942|nr:AAA family ATPase [Bradyrhizobium sp. 197]MCK1480739.1 AAA family ATPase [Bradyrhizobium sp. 197]